MNIWAGGGITTQCVDTSTSHIEVSVHDQVMKFKFGTITAPDLHSIESSSPEISCATNSIAHLGVEVEYKEGYGCRDSQSNSRDQSNRLGLGNLSDYYCCLRFHRLDV